MKISFRHKTLTFYAVICAITFGFLLIGLNVYQLWHLPWLYGGIGKSTENRPIAWICAKKTYHLKHVMDIFYHVGYKVVHSTPPPYDWDVMWSFDFPFNKEYISQLRKLKDHQRVNHVPGTGFFTLKVELATSKLPWIPQAFSMPAEKQKLLEEAKNNPHKLWVQKSNNHRGIKIVDLKGLNLNAEDTFVQQFIKNPILVNGKKFDIGIYTVITSVNPLRVYIYENEMLVSLVWYYAFKKKPFIGIYTVITSVNPLRVYIYENEMLVRFCMQDYKPFDASIVEKYVVGEDYISPSKMPSLKPYRVHGHLSRKEALFAYLRSKGKNTSKVWNDIKQSIAELFISKESDIYGMYDNYPSKHNFFELVRVDFIIDEDMNLWLMEVNMSPNLSSYGHAENKLMYEQVLLNALSLVGIATHIRGHQSPDVSEILVNDGDVMRKGDLCLSTECLLVCSKKCQLCNNCLSSENKLDLKHAYLEHVNRGNYRRVLPASEHMQKTRQLRPYSEGTRSNNFIMNAWFNTMCLNDDSWCS